MKKTAKTTKTEASQMVAQFGRRFRGTSVDAVDPGTLDPGAGDSNAVSTSSGSPMGCRNMLCMRDPFGLRTGVRGTPGDRLIYTSNEHQTRGASGWGACAPARFNRDKANRFEPELNLTRTRAWQRRRRRADAARRVFLPAREPVAHRRYSRQHSRAPRLPTLRRWRPR